MKKYFLIVLFTFLFIGCKTEEEKLEIIITNNVRSYIETDFIDKESKIDNLYLITLDTLTELSQANMYVNHLNKKFDRHIELIDLYKGLALAQINLRDLSKNYSINAESQISTNNAKLHLDSANEIVKNIANLNNRFPQIDNSKAVNLISSFLIEIKKSNKTIEKDTVVITTDLKGNIITDKELIKQLKSRFE